MPNENNDQLTASEPTHKARWLRPTPKELASALDACKTALLLLKQILEGRPDPEIVIQLANNLYDLDLQLGGGIASVEERISLYERRMADLMESPLYDEEPSFLELDDKG